MASKHGSLLAGAAGFIADVWTRVDRKARKCGATDEDIHAVVTERDERMIEEIAEKFAEVIARARQAAKNIFTFSVSATSDLKPPFDGWELVEDVASPVGTLEVEAWSFLKEGESSISGDEMRTRAKVQSFVLGERHGRALLEKQHLIPEDLRKFYLVLPGTVCRSPDGYLYVPYLLWLGGQWRLDWHWLGKVWHSDDRVLRLRK